MTAAPGAPPARRLRVPPAAVLPAALVALGGLIAAVLARTLSGTGGHFVYTLDDPYIHLALARSIAGGHYGINPGEAAAPSSSVLWPFLLAPLARIPLGLYAPLVLNAACAGLTLAVLHGLFRRLFGGASGDGAPGLRVVLLVLAVPAFNLVGLVFNGMEHSLQVLLTVAAVAGLVEVAAGRRAPWWTFAALAAGPFVRYENLAVTVTALAYLFVQGERRSSALTLAAVLAGLGAFSAALVAHGLGPLPSSILVKQAVASDGLVRGLVKQLDDMLTSHRSVVMLAGAVALAGSVVSPSRRGAEQGLAAVAVAVIALHALAGEFNSRYEIYAVAAIVLVLLSLHRGRLQTTWSARPGPTFALAVVAVALLTAPYLYALGVAPSAARNVYEQQFQMARFVAEEWRRPVAVNDLGLVALRSPAYVLDLWGLASV
ncbi:MAG TPA: hypothetical protein VF576_00315, partial [Rubricoccaceae bacterium]